MRPPQVPDRLHRPAHFPFRFSHTHHEMGPRVALAEKIDGIGEAIPIGIPLVRSSHSRAPVFFEESPCGEIDGDTHFVRSGMLEIDQVAVVEYRGGR